MDIHVFYCLWRNVVVDIQEAVEEYIAAKRRKMKPKTLSETKRILMRFAAFCAGQGIALESVRAKAVDAFLDYEKQNHPGKRGGDMSSQTLYLHSSYIKGFLSWCANDEDFEEYVPLARVRRIESPKREQFIIGTFAKEQI